MHTKSKPLNFRYGYHFSNGIPGDFGWTPPNECRDHYLSVDHYSVHQITVVADKELLFALEATEKWQNEGLQMDIIPQEKPR